MSERDAVIELVNKLFIYTDEQNWKGLTTEVFTEVVAFDMSSLGQPVEDKRAEDICKDWEAGFQGIDSINHLAGNFLVKFEGNQGSVFAYATATHFKKEATKGQTREFVGTYEIDLEKSAGIWRISGLKYNLKYMTGNLGLE